MAARRPGHVAVAVAVVTMAVAGLLSGDDPARAAARGHAPRVSFERVTLTDPAHQVPRLQALGLDVGEDVTRTSATVLAASGRDRRLLAGTGLPVRTVVADLAALRRSQSRATTRAVGVRSGLPSGRTTYRTPAEVQADLDALVAGHPGLVRRVVLPEASVDGRPITGVEIAANVNRTDDGRPVYVVMGLHHAREWPSAEIATELALDLVARQAEPRVAALLAGLRIVIVPVVNPDGFAYSRGGAPAGQADRTAALKRRNCRALAGDPAGTDCSRHRGVDLNRNYGAFWGGPGASTSPDDETYRGPSPWSEPEAQAVHELTQGLQVTGLQSLHNVAGLVLRPPGFRALGVAPDETRLKALGDAMGAATGYASRPGYALYEVTGATEDWNYVAQGAFGYTIELGGAFPGDPDFQGTYATHVVDQYLGRAGTSSAGKGVREALLLAAEEAMDRRDHIVLRGAAPAGAVLALRKRFDTVTSPRCSDTLTADACGPTAPALSLPDGLQTQLTAGPAGTFTWDAGPSTRPFVRARHGRETWTLTCTRAGGPPVTKQVFADRGQTVDVAPCDPLALPRKGTAARAPRTARVTVTGVRDRVASVRRTQQVRLTLRCPVTCTAGVRVALAGRRVASRAAVTLAAGRRTTVPVTLSAAGRRSVGRTAASRRLTATVVLRAADGSSATVARAFTLVR